MTQCLLNTCWCMSQRTDIIDDSRKYYFIGESPLLNGIGELLYIALVGRTSLQKVLWRGHWVHKDFSTEMIYHFQWPRLYGVMSRFPWKPCKISGQQTLCNWMGNANSLFFFHLGKRKCFYTVLKLKQGKIGEQNEISFCTFLFWSPFRKNKDFFEVRYLKRGQLLKKAMLIKCYVHFSICHLVEKIRFFFWARNLKRGRDLNAFPSLPFLPLTPCKENKVFFHSWELKAGKSSAGEWMEGDCSIPFMSFFKRFYILKNISLVLQHMLNPKFYHPLAALMSNYKSFFSWQIPSDIFSSKSLHIDIGCPNLLIKNFPPTV